MTTSRRIAPPRSLPVRLRSRPPPSRAQADNRRIRDEAADQRIDLEGVHPPSKAPSADADGAEGVPIRSPKTKRERPTDRYCEHRGRPRCDRDRRRVRRSGSVLEKTHPLTYTRHYEGRRSARIPMGSLPVLGTRRRPITGLRRPRSRELDRVSPIRSGSSRQHRPEYDANSSSNAVTSSTTSSRSGRVVDEARVLQSRYGASTPGCSITISSRVQRCRSCVFLPRTG